jgi:hypothetical protein
MRLLSFQVSGLFEEGFNSLPVRGGLGRGLSSRAIPNYFSTECYRGQNKGVRVMAKMNMMMVNKPPTLRKSRKR